MSARAGRNDPCPCGSKKKFKKCCRAASAVPPSPLPANLEPRHFLHLMASSAVDYNVKKVVVQALGYTRASSREKNKVLFEEYIVPAIGEALARRDYLLAWFLNVATAFSYQEQPHTEEQARRCWEAVALLFQEAGNKICKSLYVPAWPAPDGAPPGIAFAADFFVKGCAPDRVVLNLIQGLRGIEPQPFRPLVAAFNGVTGEMHAAFAALGATVVDMRALRGRPLEEDDFAARLEAMRIELARHRVTALVYYSASEAFLDLAGAARLAPVQIYYGMAFHYMNAPHWDGLLTLGAADKSNLRINGSLWRGIPLANPDAYPPQGSAEAAAFDGEARRFRGSRFPGRELILGTLGRPQKIESAEFLDVLARILRANPEAIYLWFGPEELPAVRRMMVERGISDRCVFEGWVDVKLYAKLIDIHLDSFPFPTGLTMCDTMSAARACVWMDSHEGRRMGVISHLVPFLEGEAGTSEERRAAREAFLDPATAEFLLPLAATPDEYVRLTQRMIDDAVFRAAVGAAGRRFVERFMHDLTRPARAFAEQCLEVIEETRSRNLELTLAGGTRYVPN